MAQEVAVTVRLPADLKRRLTERAKRTHRSISAEVRQQLELAVADEVGREAPRQPALGLFRGARIPSDDELHEVRALLWGRLSQRRG